MYECGFTHDARRRGNAAGDPDANLLEFAVRRFQSVCGRLCAFVHLRLVLLESFDNRSDGVFAGDCAGDVAALKLVWIDVADQGAQGLEMVAPRLGLIVLFDKRDSHSNL